MNQGMVGIAVFVVLLVGAWRIFFVEQQKYWLDLTRQRLFTIRDQLFDAAAKGQIKFDDPAYLMTRDTLNGMITFAHEVNILQLLAMYFIHKKVYKGRRATDYENRFSSALKNLSFENRRLILCSIAGAHLVMLRHIMSTSIILWPVLKPLSIVFSMLHATEKTRRKVLRGKNRKYPWPILDAEANFIGSHEGLYAGHRAVWS